MEKVPSLIPARMVNEFVYCERLFYLMWVSQLFEQNVHTTAGTAVHARVDVPRVQGDEKAPDAVTSLMLSSEELGLIAKLDLVEFDGVVAVPIDYKKGKPAPVESGVWPPEETQICVQALLLRDAGYRCESGVIWFHGSRQRVKVQITDELIERTLDAVDRARDIAGRSKPPEPLIESPKCAACAVVGLCLPYETNLLSERVPVRESRVMVPDPPGRALYISEPGTKVGTSGKTLVLRKEGEIVKELRAIDISQLCVFGKGVQVTTQALHMLSWNDVPVLYFSAGGWFRGIMHGLPAKDVELRRRQMVQASTEGIEYAKQFVVGKITNQRTMMRRHCDKADVGERLKQLDSLVTRASEAESEPTLLGIEGLAAKLYFSALPQMIDSPHDGYFEFKGRNRRPPRDPVNAVLSFLYSLLVKDLTAAALGVGFDPYSGFYHKPRFGRPALSLDMAEEFRPLIADSTMLMLINNGELTPTHFVGQLESVGLTKEGRRKVIRSYERRLDVKTKHDLFGYQVSYRRLMNLQMRVLARVVTGDMSKYIPFTTR